MGSGVIMAQGRQEEMVVMIMLITVVVMLPVLQT